MEKNEKGLSDDDFSMDEDFSMNEEELDNKEDNKEK